MLISFLLPIALTAVGIYLLIKLRFFYILHPLRTAGEFLTSARDREARRSLFLALAGTLGVGNIFGVCAGLLIGGAGVVFWLVLSSFFSSVIKYAETVLAFCFPGNDRGMSKVFSTVFKKKGIAISAVYSFLTILLALFMGAAIQSRAVCDVAYFSFGFSPFCSGIILFVLFLPCIIGGIEKIEKTTETIIPLTMIVYILMCFAVIFFNFSKIPATVNAIFSSAFRPCSIAGGGVAVAIKEGFARGILSNEAGVGTSAMAHTRTQGRSPHIAGLFAMSEVFFDTTLLCTLTAFTVLVSCDNITSFSSPMLLIYSSFCACFGKAGGYIFSFLVLFFAYSTIICWYFYGHKCTSVIFPKGVQIYAVLFVVFLLFNSFISYEMLIYSTDYILLVMSVFTLSALVKCAERIALLSKK